MWFLDFGEVLRRKYTIFGNGYRGELALTWNAGINQWTGTVFGDPVSDVIAASNFVQFRRNGNGFTQLYSGSIVDLTPNDHINRYVVVMGTFTHNEQGTYWWTTD